MFLLNPLIVNKPQLLLMLSLHLQFGSNWNWKCCNGFYLSLLWMYLQIFFFVISVLFIESLIQRFCLVFIAWLVYGMFRSWVVWRLIETLCYAENGLVDDIGRLFASCKCFGNIKWGSLSCTQRMEFLGILCRADKVI